MDKHYCFLFSLFEAAILSNLAFLPVIPDLVLLVIVYVSFHNSAAIGSTTGFISGLMLDFLSASPLGLNAMTKTITGFISGKFAGSFNIDRIFLPFLLGAGATFLKMVLTWILSLFFGSDILLYRLNGFVFWIEMLENAICAPIIFAILGLFPSLFISGEKS
ncbi:rod shape-determining protein MreD [Brucepastera parasyntrophica]|uniref:rod shape-determining protein MreD n=1 Tax=Brucepastera parasyntrophica TaxID=2880008 RepID=UPI00210D8FC3|nr:rod shape-determining protein MreD [Brucepastera parasyntrophica]ULQ59990.1 rod shape-determining protein MreD [Brucepastera parasyntrophica]